MSVVPNVAGNAAVRSAGDAKHCVGSSSLDSSETGCGAGGSSSDDSATCSFSEGRDSPSNSYISGCAIPR